MPGQQPREPRGQLDGIRRRGAQRRQRRPSIGNPAQQRRFVDRTMVDRDIQQPPVRGEQPLHSGMHVGLPHSAG